MSRQEVIRRTFRMRGKVLRLEWGTIGVLGLALLAVPFALPGSQYLLHALIIAFVFAMLAASWDVAMGYTGQLSVAHIAFFACGGYGWAFLEMAGVPAWIALVLAVAATCVLGVAIGYLCLRFRGPYILVVTLALMEVLRVLILTFRDVTGGARGLAGYGRLAGIDSLEANYLLGLAFLIAITGGLGWLGRSTTGKRLRAIRENIRKAEMLGIDTVRYKVYAFVISAGVSGLAGAFFAQYIRVVTPTIFEVFYLVYPVAMAVIGGMGTMFGPVIGSLVFISAAELLRAAGAVWENIALGVLLLLFMLFRPDGLWNLMVGAYENRLRQRLFPSAQAAAATAGVADADDEEPPAEVGRQRRRAVR